MTDPIFHMITGGPRPVAPAFQQAGFHRCPVQGPGRCPRNPGNLDALIFQKTIQNTPGKGAMRAATLKRQVDPLHIRHVTLIFFCS